MTTKSRRRGGLKPGQDCALCGQPCPSWQACVALQKLRGPLNPYDYVTIYDTAKTWTAEMVAAREADFAKRFPYMTRDEVVMASLLEAGSRVCAKAGGPTGQYSKHIANCRIRARKRGIIIDRYDHIVTKDHGQSNDDFY